MCRSAKWGRAFLERGLIEARFVKPVYDGETADVTGHRERWRADDRGREPRRALRHRHGVAAGSAPSFSICGLSARLRAVAERRPVNAASYEVGKWLGTAPRAWAGDAATEYLADIRERDRDLCAAKASAIPACCSG